MKVNIDNSWKTVLNSEFEKPYFKELVKFVNEEYDTNTCYPEAQNIFEAFNLTPFDNVKVVILGQDPYHGPHQAHGLCFSVNKDVATPPSLINIYKEINNDLGKQIPEHGNLEEWAKQGVLLLNAVLTVRAHEAASHKSKGWEKFTDAVIKAISEEKENVVFLLWGGYAKKKGAEIDHNKHYILTSGHPSPLSANRGYWFGNNHFSQTNTYLREHDQSEIDW